MSEQFKANQVWMVVKIGARLGLFFLVALGVLCGGSAARASNIYVAQKSAGGGTGGDCADARAISSLAGGDWTAGNTIHLCGTITSTIGAQGSGSSGSPITLFFEPGSGISVPALSANGQIDVSNSSWIVIDGGGGSCGFVNFANVPCAQGYIQSTANGSSLGNQVNSIAILADGSTNVEIKGLLFSNIYVHNSLSDTTTDRTYCVHGYSFPTNLSIHNNTAHDVGWCLDGGGNGLKFYNNEVYHMDHGIGVGGPLTGASVHDNHFHDMANWDTSSDGYHHDGVHFFTDNGSISNVQEYNNLFDGDIGNNDTAWIYNEAHQDFSNLAMFNNVAYVATNRNSCCGVIDFFNQSGGSGSNDIAINNTVYGPGYTQGTGSGFEIVNKTGARVQNNLFIASQNLTYVDCSTTFVPGGLSNNGYLNVPSQDGGSDTFSWCNTDNFASLSQWISLSGEKGAFWGLTSAFNLNSAGAPQSGSIACGAGVNLTSLGIAALNIDIRGNPRPTSGPWDTGAFNCGGTVQSGPVPPTNVRAVAM
jgi:hypothetical protein